MKRQESEANSPGRPRRGEEEAEAASPGAAPAPSAKPAAPSRSWIVGERVRLRKPHPCGATNWRITRVGADIRIVCEGCGHRVMLPRDQFNRQVKAALDGPRGR